MPVRMPLGRKLFDGGFRVGYACILAFQVLMLFVVGLAQNSATEKTSEEMRRYAEQEKMLVQLRGTENQSAAALTDFFLSENGDPAMFHNRIQSLREASDKTINDLEPTESQTAAELKEQFRTYWSSIERVAQWSEAERRAEGLRFMREDFRISRRPLARAVQKDLEDLREVQSKLQSDVKQELAVERGREYAVSAISIGLFVIVLSIEFAYATKQARQNSEEYARLGGAKEELSDLSARLLEVQEEERRQLSRELHDGIGQLLTALRIDLADLSSKKYDLAPDIRERLRRSRSVVEQAGSTIRDISLLLRPVDLDDLGLEPALQGQTQEFRRRSGIDCTFRADSTQNKLPDAWNTCIYRVVQEALHNCEKHAAAAAVSVQFRHELDGLLIEVQDDGRGFEAAAKEGLARRSGLGIIGMRERALKLGGELTVRSAPGRGTTVSLRLPLPPNSPGRTAAQEPATKQANHGLSTVVRNP